MFNELVQSQSTNKYQLFITINMQLQIIFNHNLAMPCAECQIPIIKYCALRNFYENIPKGEPYSLVTYKFYIFVLKNRKKRKRERDYFNFLLHSLYFHLPFVFGRVCLNDSVSLIIDHQS